MNAALMLAVVGLCLALAWWVFLPRPVFVVRIRNGTARVSHGRVTRVFLAEVDEEFRRSGLRRGAIKGLWKGRRLSLAFSGDIPSPSRQRLRNIWQITG